MNRARNARPRDDLGRPRPYGAPGAPASDEPALPPDQALTAADRLLRERRPFAAHEVLEAVWKVAPPAEADLWRGLAQLAVAVTHAARGNPTGARALAQRAAENLAAYESDPPHGVDVAALRDWCAAAAEDPTAATTPPQLRA